MTAIGGRDGAAAPTFLSIDWWGRVLVAWNLRSDRRSLAGLGRVGFATRPAGAESCVIDWDADGFAAVATDDAPVVMSASEENWRGFIAGEFNSMSGVLYGRIHAEGDVMRIVPFSRGFDDLAEVAREAAKTAG